MSFDPVEFVAVADLLRRAADAEECPGDAGRRAAIGRYYYAALLSARDFLARSESVRVDVSERTHAWVIGKLRDSSDSESQRLVSELNGMRVSRNRADCGDDIAGLEDESARMATRCGRALKYVQTLARRYGN